MYAEIGQEILLKSIRDTCEIYECYRCIQSLQITITKKRRFLCLSSYHQICELAPNVLTESATTVAVIDIRQLQKVRIKKEQNIVVLEFLNEKVFVYEMGVAPMRAFLDSLKESVEKLGMDAVQQQKPAPGRMDAELLRSYLRVVKKLEAEFALMPSIDLVHEMMNMLRQTVELSSELRLQPGAVVTSDQQQYKQIVFYIQQFLRRDDVLTLIDASYSPRSGEKPNNADIAVNEVSRVGYERSQSDCLDGPSTESITVESATIETTSTRAASSEGSMPAELIPASPRTAVESEDSVIDALFRPMTELVIDVGSVQQYSFDVDDDYRTEAIDTPLFAQQSLTSHFSDSDLKIRKSKEGRNGKTERLLARSRSGDSESLSWMDLSATSSQDASWYRANPCNDIGSFDQATEQLTLMLQSMEQELQDITRSFSPTEEAN